MKIYKKYGKENLNPCPKWKEPPKNVTAARENRK